LAAGRPADQFVSVGGVDRHIDAFVKWWSAHHQRPAEDARTLIGQYSDTNGIVRQFVSRYLATDEGLEAPPAACMLTNGAQEAIAIALLGLCAPGDFVAARDPTYVGLTGAAETLRVRFRAVPHDADLLATLRYLGRRGAGPTHGRMGIFYCVPDFSNPGAEVMDVATRRGLVDLASELGFYILEDAAYRRYRYDGEDLPTLKSFDRDGRVIYIESFAKTVIPALRLGVMVADEKDASGKFLAERLSGIKSYISVASSPIAQAVLGGILLSTDFSLREWTAPRREACHRNRDRLLAKLSEAFADIPDVSWGRPEGGFFLTVKLPFPFGPNQMTQCAERAGVIVVPVSTFASGSGFDHEIRLAFSNVTSDQLNLAVDRFAGYVRQTLQAHGAPTVRTAPTTDAEAQTAAN
jgi:(S)-3,5-dihydroxyphenylglycine transaminase